MCIPFLQLFQRRPRTVATTRGMSKVFVQLTKNSSTKNDSNSNKGGGFLKKQASVDQQPNGRVSKSKGLLL